MGARWLAGLALLGTSSARTRQLECGVEIQYPEGAAENYESIRGGEFDGVDLEDELRSLAPGDQEGYKDLRRECRKPLKKDRCRTFGVGPWNRSNFKAVGLMSRSLGEELCSEDQALLDRLRSDMLGELLRPREDGGREVDVARCNAQAPVCKKIGGKVRLVGFAGSLSPSGVKVLAQFPYLFSMLVTEVTGDLAGAVLPDSLRVLHLDAGDLGQAVSRIAPLLRSHGKVRSLEVKGGGDRVESLDLSHFCGLDLHIFSSNGVNVGHIPECWGAMKNLVSFYCVNCRMTSPPTALRGLQSLKSFVAFRQAELEACSSKKMEEDGLGPCKASWETRLSSPGDGHEDRLLCSGASYAFPFQELLYLGWTNVEKVWLDGNFLTGEIPEDIAEVWPSLQSLDLYDNNMHGEIPESLAKLDLVKLQLSGNDFSGTFPKSLAAKLSGWLHLGVAANPQLRGCLPSESGMAGTQMRTCERDEL